MQDYAWVVDLVVVTLVIVSAYLAMVRGVTRELLALASWVLAFFAAFYFAQSVKAFLPALPAMGALMSQCESLILVAFVLVFGASLVATGALFWFLSGPTRDTRISAVDSGLGFGYGALRGLVLVAVLFILFDYSLGAEPDFAFVEQALTIDIVRGSAQILLDALPTEPPAWMAARIETMMAECRP